MAKERKGIASYIRNFFLGCIAAIVKYDSLFKQVERFSSKIHPVLVAFQFPQKESFFVCLFFKSLLLKVFHIFPQKESFSTLFPRDAFDKL